MSKIPDDLLQGKLYKEKGETLRDLNWLAMVDEPPGPATTKIGGARDFTSALKPTKEGAINSGGNPDSTTRGNGDEKTKSAGDNSGWKGLFRLCWKSWC